MLNLISFHIKAVYTQQKMIALTNQLHLIPFSLLDLALKMAKNTGLYRIHGEQDGESMALPKLLVDKIFVGSLHVQLFQRI
jgi:hypothetical protein